MFVHRISSEASLNCRLLVIAGLLLTTTASAASGPDPEPDPPARVAATPARNVVNDVGSGKSTSARQVVSPPELRPQEQRKLGSAQPAADNGVHATAAASAWSGLGIGNTALSLAVVVGLIVLVAGAVKKFPRVGSLRAAIGPMGKAPSGILEVLGRYPLQRGLTLVLLRVDQRILLLSQSGSRGASPVTTLCELTQPEEVAGVITRCRDGNGESIAARFQTALAGAEASFPAVETPVRKPAAKSAPRASAAAPTNADALRLKLAAMRMRNQQGETSNRGIAA